MVAPIKINVLEYEWCVSLISQGLLDPQLFQEIGDLTLTTRQN
jgi:hypothetical protein